MVNMSQKNFQLLLLTLAFLTGLSIGYIDFGASEVQVAVFFILLFSFIFGFAKPKGAWRWALLIGAGVPIISLFAGTFSFGALVAFAPAFLGVYCGALAQKIFNLFERQEQFSPPRIYDFWHQNLSSNKLAIIGCVFFVPPLLFWISIIMAAWLKTVFLFEFIFRNFNSLTLIAINVFLPFIALLCGIIAFRQIKTREQKGRSLALAAIIIGVLQIATLMFWIASQR